MRVWKVKMKLINRIAFVLLALVSLPILIILGIVSPLWFAVYLTYITDKVNRHLWEEKSLKGEL